VRDNHNVIVGMMRDHWWWPWWVSTLIDIGIVIVGLAVFRMSSRRVVRTVAGLLVLAGLIAAVAAPIVMKEKSKKHHQPTMMN
jgi:hypothetical protein